MTEPLFRITPLLPLWAAVSMIVVLYGLMIRMEVQRPGPYRLVRILAATVMMAAIAALILRPQILREDHEMAIVLTANYNTAVLDSLRAHGDGAVVIDLSSHVERDPKKATRDISEAAPTIRWVLGDGLPPAARDVLKEKASFTYLPSALPSGIVSLNVPREVYAQTRSNITGAFHNLPGPAKLLLESAGGYEDSTIVAPGLHPFRLSFVPASDGDLTYWIHVNGKREALPVRVLPAPSFRILLVQAFPTFETRYLKDHLRASHAMVVRTTLSRNTFRHEYFNHKSIRVDRMTQGLLNDFDLVILDTDAATNLSGAELKSLHSAMENGLGVLMLPGSDADNLRRLREITGVTFGRSAKDTAHFFLGKRIVLPTWRLDAKGNDHLHSSIASKDRVLAGYSFRGFGKGGFSLLQETFRLALEGDSSSYRQLWNTVISKTARTITNPYAITLTDPFPYFPNEPLSVQITGPGPLPKVVHHGTTLPLAEDLALEDVWQTRLWPVNPGWHKLWIAGDSAVHSFYVSTSGSWGSLATTNNMRATMSLAYGSQVKPAKRSTYTPLAPWLFFGLFLVGAGILWAAPKL